MATDYLKWADRNWGLLTKLMGGHAKIYRATHGAIGHRVPGVPEMLLLDHKGAKSGTQRTTPLMFARDPASHPEGHTLKGAGKRGAPQGAQAGGSNIILIASKGGYPKNPAWYYNLKANPDTTIQIGSKTMDVRAREATPEEYERLWKLAVAVYGSYEAYRRRTERKIPLVVLEPQ